MTDQLRKAAEMALKLLENNRLRTDEHLIPIVVDDLRNALAQDEQEPVWCGCGDGIVANDEAMCGVCVMRLKDQIERMKAQLDQDHGFDRTASHMAGEYVDTNWDTSDMAHRAGGLTVEQSITQPEKKLVCTKIEGNQFETFKVHYEDAVKLKDLPVGTKLYTAPPSKPEQDDEVLNALRAVHQAQGYDGNWNHGPYMLGLYNGLELALSIAERREPVFKTTPSKWLKDIATVQPMSCIPFVQPMGGKS